MDGYLQECREVLEDAPYGRLLRWLAIRSSRMGLLGPIIDVAKDDAVLEDALFNCVSAHTSFKDIFHKAAKNKLVRKVLKTFLVHGIHRITKRNTSVSGTSQ